MSNREEVLEYLFGMLVSTQIKGMIKRNSHKPYQTVLQFCYYHQHQLIIHMLSNLDYCLSLVVVSYFFHFINIGMW